MTHMNHSHEGNKQAMTMTLPIDIDALRADRIRPDDPCLCIRQDYMLHPEAGSTIDVTAGDVLWCNTDPYVGSDMLFAGVWDKRFYPTVSQQWVGRLWRSRFVPLEKVVDYSVIVPGDVVVIVERTNSTTPGNRHIFVVDGIEVESSGWTRLDVFRCIPGEDTFLRVRTEPAHWWVGPAPTDVDIWRVRRAPETAEAESPQPEPEAESPQPEPIVEQPDVESLRAEVQALKQMVGELQAQVDQRTQEANEAHRQHVSDMATVSRHLIDEAQSRGWCSDYDRIIDTINQDLNVELDQRHVEYEVTFRLSGNTTLAIHDSGLTVEVDVRWSATTSRLMTYHGDPDGHDFTDDVDAMDLASDLDEPDDIDVDGAEVDDYSELWAAVQSSMGLYDVEVEEVDVEAA